MEVEKIKQEDSVVTIGSATIQIMIQCYSSIHFQFCLQFILLFESVWIPSVAIESVSHGVAINPLLI